MEASEPGHDPDEEEKTQQQQEDEALPLPERIPPQARASSSRDRSRSPNTVLNKKLMEVHPRRQHQKMSASYFFFSKFGSSDGEAQP